MFNREKAGGLNWFYKFDVTNYTLTFFKNVCSRGRVKPCFFVAFKIIISHIFPEIFIKISQVVQKIWRFSPSILNILIVFQIFWHFLVTKKLMTSAYNRWCHHFSYFQSTLNRLLNNIQNFIDIRLVILEKWRGVKLTPSSEKATFKKPSLTRFNILKSKESPILKIFHLMEYYVRKNFHGSTMQKICFPRPLFRFGKQLEK